MNVKKQIDYWLTTAKSDLETAEIIFKAGKNYHHCLFFCHLVLEKGLKALVAKHTKNFPPKMHDLESLALKAGIELTQEQKDFYSLMTGYSIEARYPDDKLKIYKRTTGAVAARILKRTIREFRWIEKLAKPSP
jgi:HEPN domain-containing protein